MSARKDPTGPNEQAKGKKRKRVKQSAVEQYQIESTDRYNKLHHACSKSLHREAKVVKSFECQKVVRAIKTANDSFSKDEQETKNPSKVTKRLQSLQHKLERTKKMDLDVLVQVGLRRLGVLSLDPRGLQKDAQHANNNVNNASPDNAQIEQQQQQQPQNPEPCQSEDPFHQTLRESMLRHKRLSTALDQLNDKVTEYRQWIMRREEFLRGGDNPDDNHIGEGKMKKKNNSRQGKVASANDTMVVAGGFNRRKRGLDLGGHEGASGLFIGSLSGMPAEGYDDDGDNNIDENDDYREEDLYGYQEGKKKNRPGQRARRAKAMAIEARKTGKTWDSSINWREKKKDGNEMDEGRHTRKFEKEQNKSYKKKREESGAKPNESQNIATMGKGWKEEGNAHPSWAAAAQKTQGIAKFQGTKITFD